MAVTEQDVLDISDTSLTADEIAPFLSMALSVVSARVPAGAYSNDHLDKIVAAYAGHFIQLIDPSITEQTVDETTVKYQKSTGEGLSSTPCGQIAQQLDYQAYLSRSGEGECSIESAGATNYNIEEEDD